MWHLKDEVKNMKLEEYLDTHDISQREFGALVGVSQGYVSHVIVGRHKPYGKKAIEWAEATRWRVTPHELNPDIYPNPFDGLPEEIKVTAATKQS